MTNKQQSVLTKREQQVMEVAYRRKTVSAKDVWAEVPDFPSYSAVRSVLTILEGKGFLAHHKEGKRYVYFPVIAQKKAMRSALKQLMSTYFDNSLEKTVSALLEIHTGDLTDDDFRSLAELIDRTRKEDTR